MKTWGGNFWCTLWRGTFAVVLFFAVTMPLSAQEEVDKRAEPLWVISWAVFFLFIALTIGLLARPTKRKETLLNPEELKDYEKKLGEKVAELNREEDDDSDDD